MDGTAKQTALFFGFLAAAMTHALVQAAPAEEAQAEKPAMLRGAADLGHRTVVIDARNARLSIAPAKKALNHAVEGSARARGDA